MTTDKKPKASRVPTPSDDISDMVAKALTLRIAVLQAQKALKGVQDDATGVIGAAQEVFIGIRDVENEKMSAEQVKVDSANTALSTFGEEMNEKLGVDNALGVLGASPISTPTPQVRI